MYYTPVRTAFGTRHGLRWLLELQHAMLFTSPTCSWHRSADFSGLKQCLIQTDTSFRPAYTSRTCPSHTTTTAGGEVQIQSFTSSPAFLGRRMGLGKPWAAPIPAASLGRPHVCKTLSFSATASEPSAGAQDPPSDPPTDPSKDQPGPCDTSRNNTNSQQQPLLGLKKKSSGPVAVAISGGVDSAVAAMLLKEAG